jgi:hypothetical protein
VGGQAIPASSRSCVNYHKLDVIRVHARDRAHLEAGGSASNGRALPGAMLVPGTLRPVMITPPRRGRGTPLSIYVSSGRLSRWLRKARKAKKKIARPENNLEAPRMSDPAEEPSPSRPWARSSPFRSQRPRRFRQARARQRPIAGGPLLYSDSVSDVGPRPATGS